MTFATRKYNRNSIIKGYNGRCQQQYKYHHSSIEWRSCLLLVLLLLLLGLFEHTVIVTTASLSVVDPVVCNVAYSRNAKPVQLSIEQMNDGYCDCIWDGTDETLTTACAGYSSWPGTTLLDAPTQKETSIKELFQCPEEAKLQISLSKLSDGICDCCDGADENTSDNKICTDQCAEIRAANAAAKAVLIEKYTVGSTKRQQALTEYNNFVTNVKNEIQQYQIKVQEANQVIETIQGNIKTLKTNFTPLRMETYIQFISQPTTGPALLVKQLLDVFQLNELQWLLVYLCQVSGEILGSSDIKTCIPLRLAGLDLGITWEPNTYKLNLFNPKDTTQVDAFVSYANILSYNIDQDDVTKRVWNAKMIPKSTSNNNNNDNNKKPKHRRLEEDHFDDEDDYKDDEDDYDDHDNDDDVDYNTYNSQREQEQQEAAAAAKAKLALMDDISDTTNKDELVQKLHQLSLSQQRIQFTTEANRILKELEEIEKALEAANADDNDDTNDDKATDGTEQGGASSSSSEGDAAAVASTNESEPKKPSIDPMALTMIRNTLNDRIKVIDSGYNFAVSSLVLIDAIFDYYSTGGGNDRVEEKQQLLSELILGTIYHGQISTVQLYELFQHVLPELQSPTSDNNNNNDNDKETCKFPWAELCAVPKFAQRDGVTIPPKQFVDAIAQFCSQKEQQFNQQQQALGGVCLSSQPITTDNIPSDIPDGYYGYTVVTARDESDIFNSIIHEALLQGDSEFKKQLSALENDLNKVENDERFMLGKIDELNNSIGGQDDSNNKYGPNGELHGIRDSCFDIQAGKYIYEVCLYQGAKQRDAGTDRGSHGTSLGRWKGYSNESNTGRRVWEWTDGDKCWNGPHRSATVYVTCGKDNILLTAEEPDTCRYVFEMESPIACDDEFRIQNDL